MQSALRGGRAAPEELLGLADRTADGGERFSRLWGLLGLDKLRGTTPRTRRVGRWQRWLTDVLASRLTESERLVYPKKHGAIVLALGHEPMLTRRGPERTKVVLVAFDTSGSMPDAVVEWLTTLAGQTDGVESHWLSFDGVVMPFVPGERVAGGARTAQLSYLRIGTLGAKALAVSSCFRSEAGRSRSLSSRAPKVIAGG